MTLIPASLLFRCRLAVRPIQPPRGSAIPMLSADHRLPLPIWLDQPAAGIELRAGWCQEGLALTVFAPHDHRPLEQRSKLTPTLRFWFDTRNTQSVHRATRYCHGFELLVPARAKAEPRIRLQPIPRAAQEPGPIDLDAARATCERDETGLRIVTWFGATALSGYRPGEQPQLGFYLQTLGFGAGDGVTLTQSNSLPFDSDPSLWQTLDLVGA